MGIWLVFAAYAIGGIPFAFLLARLLGGTDVRYSGSGNIGTANVLRTTGAPVALAVLALDLSKGYVVVFAARALGFDAVAQGAVAAAVVIGHMFPMWLKFRGGKGVATGCGAFTVLAPTAALGATVIFVVGVWLTGYVSVGSMSAALSLTPLTYLTGASPPVVVSALGVATLVLLRHRPNVLRLRAGKERRLGERGS